MKQQSLVHRFVETVPEILDEGVLYISISYTTVAHLCCCGCGQEVITPLSSTDWELIFNGETVSLYPSIGNWSFSCRSHYWVKRNKVEWAGDMSLQKIEEGRMCDRIAKEKHYGEHTKTEEEVTPLSKQDLSNTVKETSPFSQFINSIKSFWF